MYWKQGRVTILVRVSRDFQHDLQNAAAEICRRTYTIYMSSWMNRFFPRLNNIYCRNRKLCR